MKKRKTAKKQIRAVINTIVYISFLLLTIALVLRFVGQRTTVQGVSMEPALSQGDQIFVDKLSYRFEEPERFSTLTVLPCVDNLAKLETGWNSALLSPAETVKR